MGKRYTASITASPAMKVLYFRAVTRNLAATHGLPEIPCSRMCSRPKLPEYRISCAYCIPYLDRGGTPIGMQASCIGTGLEISLDFYFFRISGCTLRGNKSDRVVFAINYSFKFLRTTLRGALFPGSLSTWEDKLQGKLLNRRNL